MPVAASYISATQFAVASDVTAKFVPGLRVCADCGDDLRKGSVAGSIYDAATSRTLVTLDMDAGVLTDGLTSVAHGYDTPDSLARATTDRHGAVRLATVADAVDGIDTSTAVTPAGMAAALANTAGLSDLGAQVTAAAAQATLAASTASDAAGVATSRADIVLTAAADASAAAAAAAQAAGSISGTPILALGSSTYRGLSARFADTINVMDFGAIGDGVTDDTAAIQAAIDYCASLSNGASVMIPAASAYYSVGRINAKSGVTIIVPNKSTKIVQERGTTWDTKTSLGVGGYFGSDYTTPKAYAVNSISIGDQIITLATAGDGTNFLVGDCIFIETTTGYTVGTYNVPAYAQMNVITEISGGVIYLRHPIQETQTNVQVRNFSRTGQHTLGGTQALEAVRDFKLIGGTWINKYGAFNADGGCIDCVISPDVVDAIYGIPYGNCYAHCTIRVPSVITTRIPFAIALGAHNTSVEIGHISCVNDSTLPKLVELSEGCRDCTVRIGSIAVAAPIVNAVEIVTGRRNIIDIGSISVETVSGAAVYIWNPAYTGTEIPVSNNNRVTINSVNASTIACGTLIAGTTTEAPTGNFVSVFCSGAVATDQSYSNAGRNIVDVRTQRWQALELLQFDAPPFSVTQASPYTKTTIIKAGLVRAGDRINISLRGVSTGMGGSKSISIVFAGVTLYSYTIPAASTQGIDIDCVLGFPYDTICTSNTTAVQETAVNAEDVAVSGLDLTANDYNLVIAIACSSAGDTVAIRQMALTVSRKTIQ